MILKNRLKKYGLYSSIYLSPLVLSWNTMFNMKKVDIEVILDTDMYMFFVKSARGGVSYISSRWR